MIDAVKSPTERPQQKPLMCNLGFHTWGALQTKREYVGEYSRLVQVRACVHCGREKLGT